MEQVGAGEGDEDEGASEHDLKHGDALTARDLGKQTHTRSENCSQGIEQQTLQLAQAARLCVPRRVGGCLGCIMRRMEHLVDSQQRRIQAGAVAHSLLDRWQRRRVEVESRLSQHRRQGRRLAAAVGKVSLPATSDHPPARGS